MERLRTRIDQSWRQLGVRRPPRPADLLARYAESHRAYHTLEHLSECFAWLASAHERAERPAELALALAYHDAVYDPQRTDNERRSAAAFEADAARVGLARDPTRRIAALIEQTADHGMATGDGALLNDIDLSILGASPYQYERYLQQIRREYAHATDEAFRCGRTLVVRDFLQRTSIFHTPLFARRLEPLARRNLSAELDRLQSPATGATAP